MTAAHPYIAPSMPIGEILARLEGMPIGYTTSVGDRVVTRWSADRWEVGTFGRMTSGLDIAVEVIAN